MTRNAPQTHCHQGHPLSGDNLRVADRKNGKQERICKTCARDRNRESLARRKGVVRPLSDAKERLLAGTSKSAGCWEWQGQVDRDGYGRMTVNYRPHLVHRVAYELFIGAIPEDYEIDHLCRNRPCVNPAHLEAVTKRENSLRSLSPPAINAQKTHCIHGHEFTPENTRIDKSGRRGCRACGREQMRKYYQQRKAAS